MSLERLEMVTIAIAADGAQTIHSLCITKKQTGQESNVFPLKVIFNDY